MGVETYGCSRPQQSSVTRFCGGEERDSRLTGHWLRGRQDATLVLPTRASTCEKQFCAGQHAVWKRRADTQRYPGRFDVLDHESVVAQTRDSG